MNTYLLNLTKEVVDLYDSGRLDNFDIKAFAFTMMELHRDISKESAFAISQEWMYSVDVFDGFMGEGGLFDQ